MNIDYSDYGFIFDMDGTLVDNMRFHTRAWTQMLTENGLEEDPHDFLVKTAGKTNREIIPEYFGDISDAEIARLGGRKEELYREFFRPERKTIKGALDFLEKARKLEIRLAVATSAPDENVEFILGGLGLRRFFQAVTTADDVENGKPHPESFLTSAAKLGIQPENCLVFEDALNGFEAAQRAGMKAVGITTVNPPETVRELPSVIAVGADFAHLDPQELIFSIVQGTKAVESN
jgi:beta-phosphoglucomutase family hydrolase